jgi:signal transduction histidine kinase
MIAALLPRRRSLSLKFIALLLPVSVLIATTTYAVIESAVLYRKLGELDERGGVVANDYAAIAGGWLWNLDRDKIELSLATLLEDSDVLGAQVLDEFDDVFASAGILDRQQAIAVATSPITFQTDSSSEHLGRVEIFITDQPTRAAFYDRLKADGIFMLVLAAAITAAAVFANRRTVQRPLRRMIDALEATEGAELPDPVAWQSDDEIGEAIAAFNHMMDRRRKALDDKNNLEVQLRQAQKMEALGTLASGIAHEINTPIQYIGNNVAFLGEATSELIDLFRQQQTIIEKAEAEGLFEAEIAAYRRSADHHDLGFILDELQLAIEQSQGGIEHVTNIVAAMKEFAHTPGQDMRPICLEDVVRCAVDISKGEWKLTARVEIDPMPDLPMVLGHRGELNQVVLNLIINAAHAIQEQGGADGLIRIRAESIKGSALLHVEDNGAGIPEAIASRIFEPFFTTKEVGKGTGQGLAFCYDVIVNKHHGCIDVDSMPGQGTRFTIALPVTSDEQDAAECHQPADVAS